MTILQTIKEKIEDFEKTSLEVNPSYAPTLKDIIKLIDLYWVSKFRDGDKDSSGYKKAFFNIVNYPVEVASKMIDIDTKDIRIIAEKGQSYWPAWLFEKDLKIWMKEQKFAKFLNEIVYNWPKYGTVVVKKVREKLFLVPLQNFYVEPTAKNLENSIYIIEEHDLTLSQLQKFKGVWENVDKAIEKAEDNHITVYECFLNIPGEPYNYWIVSDIGDGIVHVAEKRNELHYKELHWDKIPGRWLGRGMVERLFEEQIAINQNENLFRAGLRWTSKHIFQTRDETVASNLLTDVEDGDLLIVQSEITPIVVEERNLHAYRESDAKWETNVMRKSFAYDIIRGERPPAGTPLGTAILQTKMVSGYFDLKREDLGVFLKEILFDWVIPEFKKQRRAEHILSLGEFDEFEVDRIKKLVIRKRLNDAILDYIERERRLPNFEERRILEATVKQEVENAKEIVIPADFYKDLKYKIDILITAEQIDMAAKLTTLQTVLQIIGSNPTILEDKRTKKIFYRLLDLAGINPMELEFEEEENPLEVAIQTSKAKRGGSIAKVSLPTGLTEIPTEVRI